MTKKKRKKTPEKEKKNTAGAKKKEKKNTTGAKKREKKHHRCLKEYTIDTYVYVSMYM